MRPTDGSPAVSPGPGEAGLLPTEFGDAASGAVGWSRSTSSSSRCTASIAGTVGLWYPRVTASELGRIEEHVGAYCGSSLARRLAALRGARPERPFTFEVDGVLLRGRVDVLWRSGPRALVLDYKTNAIVGHDPAQVVEEEYRLQRAVYGLVCLLAGAEEAEVVYQFLERPEEVVSVVYRSSDRDALVGEVSAAIARVTEGRYAASPSAFACQGCPILGVACAGLDLLPEEH
jgi:hypothetical protein